MESQTPTPRKIFDNKKVPQKQIVNIDELKNIVSNREGYIGAGYIRSIQRISTPEELMNFFADTTTPNLDTKRLLELLFNARGIQFDKRRLEKLMRNETLQIIRDIFEFQANSSDTKPAAKPEFDSKRGEIVQTNPEIVFDGRVITLKDFLKKIFPNGRTMLAINVNDIKRFVIHSVQDFSPEYIQKIKNVYTAEDLMNFFADENTSNLDTKRLLEKIFKGVQLGFDENMLKKCNRKNVLQIWRNMFEIQDNLPDPKPTQKPVQESISESETDSEIDFSFDTIDNIITHCKQNPGLMQIRRDIDVTEFTIAENKPVTVLDNFCIAGAVKIYHGLMAVVTRDSMHETVAVGSLQYHDNQLHIILPKEKIHYKAFENQTNFDLLFLPDSAKISLENSGIYNGEILLVDCQIDFKRIETATSTLCIDFGTSNTTVGTYGIKDPYNLQPEIVNFLDSTSGKTVARTMLPTVVYILRCSGGQVREYSFGYDALKRVIDEDYNPTATVFYEIKRWINDFDSSEDVVDVDGNKATVQHREIITAYLNHVIELAEQYFERRFTSIHFTAPVKLKDSFIHKMKDIFEVKGSTRTVFEPRLSLDEGIAIIYYYISKQIREYANSSNKNLPEQNILIMDCGGGTTDLASCTYSLDSTTDIRKLNIRTQFLNGDSNFGGNNITFRILQLLKIKLAYKLKHSEEKESSLSVQDLISQDEESILQAIDSESTAGIEEVYRNFEDAYTAAEEWIPTKFKLESFKNRKGMLKRNFYYLWQMAEAYKIQFYRDKMNFVAVDFNNDNDRKIGIPDDGKYYLYLKKSSDSSLEKMENPMSGITITNNEIHLLLYADIYSLLKKFFDNEADKKRDYYKLSGQSCKITLFHELLKEFIPGRKLRYSEESSSDSAGSTDALKLACIRGSIFYVRDMRGSAIKPQITMDMPERIYSVYKLDMQGHIVSKNQGGLVLGTGQDELLPRVEVLPANMTFIRYAVVDMSGKIQNTIQFDFNRNTVQDINTTWLEDDIAKRTYDSNPTQENENPPQPEQENIVSNAGAGIVNTEKSIRRYDSRNKYENIGRYIADKLTNIAAEKETDDVFAIFLIPAKNGYGFYVYCVKKLHDRPAYQLQQKPRYYSYENSRLDTFFDGGR